MVGQVIDLDEIQARIAAQQGGSALPSSETGRRALDRSLVRTVWHLMGSLFGHRWVSAYGADVDPDNVWAASLAGIDEQQVRSGMRALVEKGYDWPPSAPEFRKLCEGRSEAWEHRTEAYQPFPPDRSLPDKTAEERRDRVGRQHMAALRASFGLPPRGAA
jgi:hypothetical protein